MAQNTNALLKKQARLLYESKELRAVFLPTKVLTTPNNKKLFKDWKVQWETSQPDLLGETAWIGLEDDTPSDLYGLDLTALHDLESWQRVKEMASAIVEQLNKHGKKGK